MSPRTISDLGLRDVVPLHAEDRIEDAVRRLLADDLPALPVLDARGRFVGIFGEREFMSAVFPGYIGQLRYAGFVSRALDVALEKRETCRDETVARYMNTEHVDVAPDFSDVQLAEIFFHHRVLVVPVVRDGQLEGVVTRHDFFRMVAERFAHDR